MLGKLMKYEWRGLRKPMLILLAILAGTTLLTSILILSINPENDEVVLNISFLTTLASVMIYYFGLIACSLGVSLAIAIRFYKTCYTDQGYLTHTLPVSTRQLVGAKTIVACLCQLIMMICIVLSLVILIGVFFSHMISFADYNELNNINHIFYEINEEFTTEFGISFTAFCVFICGFSLISCVTSTMIIMGCVSLGQLYTKHRVLGAIIAYFLVTFVMQIAAYIGMIPFYANITKAEIAGETLKIFPAIMPMYLPILIVQIILAIGMYFTNIHMMTKRLNLE